MENHGDNHQGQRGLMLDDRACTFELETTFDDNMGSYGNMFDIKTLGGEISIYAMDIYVDVMKLVNYEIYTKPNSFKDDNGKLSLQPWTLVKKGSVVGAGRHAGTPIRDFSLGKLTMAPNEVRAFYVTLDSSDLRYRNITEEMPTAVVGDLYIDNEDIAVYVGVSVGGFPLLTETPFFGKRAWSGRFYYQAGRTCVPSASPSVVELPSISPTPVPSRPFDTSSPTASPTTADPTVGDTFEPTVATWNVPSRARSADPTETATTTEPSIALSSEPTVALSFDPTIYRSSEPSVIGATLEPTLATSTEPTAADTSEPTESPSSEPTVSSFPTTSNPSPQPSSSPSTLKPTSQPTLEPSESPTVPAPTLLPTLEISATPSRAQPDEWICSNKKVLQTALDGGTGAFGNMFTVTAKGEPVRITTLSLHTDYEGGNITAMVYTRLGDFAGYENEPRAWRKISHSTFRGAGHGFLSKIPMEEFEPLYLFANDTVAIYITLTTADMRYSRTNSTLGSIIASNDYIDISAGVGVADYPFASEFFLYAPRVFNGAIHFNTDADCLPMMNISYSFNVQHPKDITGIDLNRLIENNVEMTARSLISTEPVLVAQARDHQVSIDCAQVLQVQGSCKPLSSTHACAPIDATVCIKYAETLRVGELRFKWLQEYKEITRSVNLMFDSTYVGDMPVEDVRIISLDSRVVATPMTNATQRVFEMVVMKYLQKELSKKNVTILDVQITGQDIKVGDDAAAGRLLQRDTNGDDASRPASTIDVSTNINGQYRPPPEIDYSSSVEDAIGAKPQDLDQSLKRADTYFEIVEGVSSKKDPSKDNEAEFTPPYESTSSSNALLIVLLSLLGVFLLFVSCTWYLRRRQRRRRRFAGPSFVQDSEVLQEKKSLFGGFRKGKQSILDAYATADVAWAGSAPVSKSPMYDRPYSWPNEGSPYFDDPEKSVAAQFQDMGEYG
ncbi:hypothetical protein MHU86_7420 [Fragilaria crotonensis]|nr:hypothetical protein MHU86_7420 [Fragilaria crotonensis]